jgi:hypothetical protein
MLLALCSRRIANAAKSYLVVQAKWREITTFGFLMQKSQVLHWTVNGPNRGLSRYTNLMRIVRPRITKQFFAQRPALSRR